MSLVRTAPILLACLLGGCTQANREDWLEIQSLGDVSLFLDTSSIQKVGQIATFWTKLDSSNWLKRQFKDSEVRMKRQFDCQHRTWRNLEGGVFVDGSLKFPVEDLRFGKVPTTGYIKQLYDHVCG